MFQEDDTTRENTPSVTTSRLSRGHPWNLTTYESVSSTMDVLKQILNDSSCEKYHAVLAQRQQAGRGRRGRSWQSEEGNLFLSFSLPFDQDRPRCFEVSFSCAIALEETIRSFCESASLTLKWPNDILLEGRKLSGVLIEGVYQEEELVLVIGVGVNLKTTPNLQHNTSSPVSYEGIALAEYMTEASVPSPIAFTKRFLPFFNFYEAKRKELGFSFIREKWLEKTFPRGTFLTVSSECASIVGPFLDLDAQGRLLVGESIETAKAFTSGDVLVNKGE